MVGFSRHDAVRVAASTIYVEGIKKTRPAKGGSHRPSPNGFWAKLNSRDVTNRNRYGWLCVEWDENGDIQGKWEWGSANPYDDENYAIENYNTDQVPYQTTPIVWLEGQNGKEPYFTFDFGTPIYTGYSDTTLTSGSGSYPGSGYWYIWDWDEDYGQFRQRDRLEIYNPFPSTIPSSTLIQAQFLKGYWFIISAAC